jgi:Flp pilus assembly protein TadD
MDPLLARPNSSESKPTASAGLPARAQAESTQGRTIAALFAEAVRCQQCGQSAKAFSLYSQILALHPGLPEVHYNQGVLWLNTGQFDLAEAAFRHAIALNPDFPEACNNLGELLRVLGKLDEAELLLRRAIVLRQTYAEAFSNLGNTLKEKQRFSEAEAAFHQAIAHNPRLPEPHGNLGVTLMHLGRLEDAKEAMHRAITLRPDFAEAHHNLGLTLKHLGHLPEAQSSIEQAIELAPSNASFFLSLSEFKNFSAGDMHLAAMEDLGRNIETLSTNQQINLHFALGKAYDDIGRHDRAFNHLAAGNFLKRRQVIYDEAKTLAQLDRTRELFTPDLLRTCRNAGESSSMPVFIVGMPRSGSTLIEQILASHPDVYGAGELPNLGDAVASFGNEAGHDFPEAVLHLSRENLRKLGARYVAETAPFAPNAKRIVDKMPSNFLFLGLIHLALPNARIIHAVRDAADTCLSCFSKHFTTGLHHTYDLAELGRYYRRYESLMRHWHRVLPRTQILEVRYEDIVTDLESSARQITAHCGLEWDRRCLMFHENERPVFTASAAQVRRPLYRNAIGRAEPYRKFLEPLLAELPEDQNRRVA